MESIITKDMSRCYICGSPSEQIHHCMNGANRKKSEKYGLIIPICHECHTKLHDKDDNMLRMRKIAQRKFEELHSRGLWMTEFGKNYLWEEE